MTLLLEGLVMAFWLLLICVVGIANGPVGLVVFYEQDVQDRVVELGSTTKEKIQKTATITRALLLIPMLTVVPAIEIAKAQGKYTERKPIEIDWTRFGQLYGEWKSKSITGRDFMRRMVSVNLFMRSA